MKFSVLFALPKKRILFTCSVANSCYLLVLVVYLPVDIHPVDGTTKTIPQNITINFLRKSLVYIKKYGFVNSSPILRSSGYFGPRKELPCHGKRGRYNKMP